jgi:tRNA pseudouridine38-40 synthase
MPLQRYKLTIAYRGSRSHGWQMQPMLPSYKGERPRPGQGIATIQEILTRALQGVVGHPITLVGSSRTDAGVHAKGQVAHFDTDQIQIPPEGMRRALNHALPDDILIRRIEPAPDSFNAIASTFRKRYQYAIWNAPDRPLFFFDLAWHRWQELNVDAMRAGAARLVGTHDFTSFARPRHGRADPTRTVFACDISFRSPRLIIAVEGDGFLWNMVRIMVGTLVEVGLGRRPDRCIDEMLQARDRRAAGPTAPPQGLYLQWIQFRQVR